jgi:hypothetical protein
MTISPWFAAFALSLSVFALWLDLGPEIENCLRFTLSTSVLLSPFLIGSKSSATSLPWKLGFASLLKKTLAKKITRDTYWRQWAKIKNVTLGD